MLWKRNRRVACCMLWAILASPLLPAAASDNGFPFGSALMLDAGPRPGSKRVPMLQIDESGAAAIDLWCASVQGQATVGDGTITIVPTSGDRSRCAPEQQAPDENLLTALMQVTNWRRQGDLIELSGATTLRFRLMTN